MIGNCIPGLLVGTGLESLAVKSRRAQRRDPAKLDWSEWVWGRFMLEGSRGGHPKCEKGTGQV